MEKRIPEPGDSRKRGGGQQVRSKEHKLEENESRRGPSDRGEERGPRTGNIIYEISLVWVPRDIV